MASTFTMDLSDRFVDHDHWHTARLLDQAAALADDQLDRPLRAPLVIHSFEGPERDARTMLDRIVLTKEGARARAVTARRRGAAARRRAVAMRARAA